jgi:uncharacterized repeat protein (TIGR01451 family)
MKLKSTAIGSLVLLACLAGWIVNCAMGQPSPGQTPAEDANKSSAPVAQQPPPMWKTEAPKLDMPAHDGPDLTTHDAPKTDMPTTNDLLKNFGQKYGNGKTATQTPATPTPSSPVTPTKFQLPDLPAGGSSSAFGGLPQPGKPFEPPAAGAAGAANGPAFPDANSADAGSQSTDNPTGRQEPAVSLEWIGPASAKLGQSVTYQIIVKNISSLPVQQVVVRNKVPPGITVQATEPKAFTEVNTLVWDLGTLQPRQEKRLDMQLLPETKGDIACQALVSFTGASTARIRVCEPKLTMKAIGPDKVLLSDTATVTLTVNNPGDGAADHVKIKADLSDGLEHVRGKTVEVDLGNLGAGETRSVQLVCATKQGGPQSVTALATAEGNLRAQDMANMEVIVPRLDLIVSGPKLRYLDRHAIYVFKVSNPGSAPASNVTITDQLPDGFKFLTASDGGRHDFATRSVSWYIGDLTPGQAREVSMETVAINAGNHKHLANVTAARGLKTEADITTRVEGLPALLMELVDLDDPVEVGADTAYEIRVTNTGSKTETNLVLMCTVPDKMEFRGAKGAADCKFHVTGHEVAFEPLPRLAPRADAIYRVNVRGIAPGDLRFRASITADGLTAPVLKEESTKVYGDDAIK